MKEIQKDLFFKSAIELSRLLREGQLTCTSLLDAFYAQIEQVDSSIKAFLRLEKNRAYEEADTINTRFQKGDALPPLAGIPIALKDNICVQNSQTTCGSKILENYISPYNATLVNKLKSHSLIPIGKTNMDEFAMGSSTENSAFYPTRNPWNSDYVPGGSSGGSCAAVAIGEAPLAIGSDTGGSIRQPASFCGVVGMKPTYGRVSRYGLVAFASSLDQMGPISRTVEDTAHLLNVICGHDPHDSTSSPASVPDFTAALHRGVQGLKIGVPSELFNESIQSKVKASLEQGLNRLKEGGATWEVIPLPVVEYAVPTYYIIAPAEASANLARFDGVRYGYRNKEAQTLKNMMKQSRGKGFGREVQRRIILGTYALSSGYYDAYYLKAQKVRTLIKEAFQKAFAKYDVIITPTSPTLPFRFGEHTQDPLSMYLADIATIPVNLAGLPALSIPCGFAKGLPIGMQLIGKAFDEETLLAAGHWFQTVTNFHKQTPNVISIGKKIKHQKKK